MKLFKVITNDNSVYHVCANGLQDVERAIKSPFSGVASTSIVSVEMVVDEVICASALKALDKITTTPFDDSCWPPPRDEEYYYSDRSDSCVGFIDARGSADIAVK